MYPSKGSAWRGGDGGNDIALDERLVQALRDWGPLTVERLVASSGMSWSELFFTIDRLSRSGRVTIKRLRRCEYEVSLGLFA